MANTRYSRRRMYNLTLPWDDVMAGLASPEVWYKFEDASTSFANSGSDTTAMGAFDTFITASAEIFQHNSVSTEGAATGSGAGITYDGAGTSGGAKIETSTDENLTRLNTSAPAGTGTFVILFRAEWGTMDNHITPWLFWSAGGTGGIGVRWVWSASEGPYLQWEVRKDATNYVQYPLTNTASGFTPGTTAWGDGNWHMLAVVHDGTAPTFYVDGSAIATPTAVTAGTGAATDWVDDITTTTGETGVGGSSNNDLSGMLAVDVDELVYWDGVEISAANILLLWESVSSVADGAANGQREGFYFAFNAITGGPDSCFTPTGNSTNFCKDQGFGAALAGGNAAEGTPDFYYGGATKYTPAMQVVSTSYIAGEGWTWTAFDATDWSTDTAGTIVIHMKVTTANAWNAMPWSIGPDQDNVVDNGTGYIRLLTNDTLQFYILSSAGTAMDYRFDYTTEGTYDLEDGNWHQVIVQQPADGNGIRLWIDGTLFDYNHAQVTQDATNKDFWFNDMDPAWSTSEAMGIGCFLGSTGTGQYSVEGLHGVMVIDDYATVFTAAQGTRLAASMGL